MFDFVRDNSRLALGFMLLLIIPSFVFFGVQGYDRFTEPGQAAVATVDGATIKRVEWEDAMRRYTDNVRRQQPNVDPAVLDTPEIRKEVLDNLLRERVLASAASELKLQPTVQRMARLFDSDPQVASLRGADGKLSRDLLAMQGMTPELFDQRFRQDLAVRQVAGGVTQSAPVAAQAASAAFAALFQRREAELQRFIPASYKAQVQVTDEQVAAYYKAQTDTFKAPEQARIEYVVLGLDAVAKGVTLGEAELRKAYEDNAAKYTEPEERRASHILIKADKDAPAADRAKAKARAQELLLEARKAPAQFAALAQKNSQDPGSAAKGGDLDFFPRGAMVKPFEDATFKLKAGEISEVVESDFGYHVIQLVAVRGGQSKPFEAVKGELEAELRKTAAQKRWAEVAEQFSNLVYEQSDTLKPAADKLGLVVQSATVPRTPAAGAAGPLASAKLLSAVFGAESLRTKRNTDAIEVAPNQLVAARLVEHLPARTRPLDEVKEDVRLKVQDEQARALARKDGEARVAALKDKPTDPLGSKQVFDRRAAQALPKPLLDAILGADPKQLPLVRGVDLGEQGYVVVRVNAVLPLELPPGADKTLQPQYAQAWAAAESEAYVAALRQRLKASVKPAAASYAAEAASANKR